MAEPAASTDAPVAALASATRPVGYAALIERFALKVVPNYRTSFIAAKGPVREVSLNGLLEVSYPPAYDPGDTLGDHLEFALKYDGTNLEILKAVFEACDPAELADYVQGKPTGKYARRLWFFYEMLTERRLNVPSLKVGNYVDALEAEEYYTSVPIKSPRQRINDNLLGGARFCPVVRRTAHLKELEARELDKRVLDILDRYDRDTINRAVNYLYTKETLSSFAIEREKPSPDRAERFSDMLKRAHQIAVLDHAALLEIRNMIVEPRYERAGYRDAGEEVYVGESISRYRQKVHFVGAPSATVPDLMEGLLTCFARMTAAEIHPVITASVVSFGFVFIHPFDDGNGRTHRFLVHYILSKEHFTPEGLIFPVSSTMVSDLAEYDACLERFSKPIMKLADYSLDEDGRITLRHAPVDAYRYFDATHIADYLFYCIQQTIVLDFVQELNFLAGFKKAKEQIQAVVDMPDRKVDLFIKLCLQNRGRLSRAKADEEFSELTAGEIEALEAIVGKTVIPVASAFRANG